MTPSQAASLQEKFKGLHEAFIAMKEDEDPEAELDSMHRHLAECLYLLRYWEPPASDQSLDAIKYRVYLRALTQAVTALSVGLAEMAKVEAQ